MHDDNRHRASFCLILYLTLLSRRVLPSQLTHYISLYIYIHHTSIFLLNEQKELVWNVRPVGKLKFFLNVSPRSIFTLVRCWDWCEYYYYVMFVIFLVSCLACMIARYIAYSVLSFLDSSTPPSPKADSVDYTLSYIYKVPLVVN